MPEPIQTANMPQRPRGRRRPHRPGKRRMFSLRKAMFVLPNLFTVSSIFCGFYAILLAGGTPGPAQMYKATLAIFFGIFFDMADGRVARLTRTQSDFGVQLDSLADCCTFGLAPAVIVYKWGLTDLGLWGALVAFTYVACGAMRLARFNVMAARNLPGSKKWFMGLPIPLAAGVLVSLVMFYEQNHDTTPMVRKAHIITLLLILSYLMVSNVRYRAFKDVALNTKSLLSFAAMATLFVWVAVRNKPPFALLTFFSGYVAVGLFEEVIFFRRRRREDRAAQPTAVPPGADDAP
jgi:CDP-diacylglycerol--serine O-phosphatidyltransferase